MLSRLCGADHKFSMEGVGQNHIHNVDVGVAGYGIEILIIIHAVFIQRILLNPLLSFFRGSCDDTSEPAVLGFEQGGSKLFGAVLAEAHECDTKFTSA